MTTVTITQLVAPQNLALSDAQVYLAPVQTTAKIGRAVFCNTSATPTTITAAITTGGAINTTNTLIAARPLAAGESYTAPELAGACIPANSTLRAFAGVAGVVFTASGITVV